VGSLHADDLVDLVGVEIEHGRNAGRRGSQRRLAFAKRGANSGRELHRIAMPADMHVVSRRVAAQNVVMNSRDLDSVLDQLGHDWSNLGVEQYETAHHHCPAVRRLERGPTAERKRGPDCYAIDRDLQVGAREAVAMDVTGYGCAASDCGIDLL